MIQPGYYDISFEVECEEYSADPLKPGEPMTPIRTYKRSEVWLGARVLMIDGADLIVEHYPAGWVGVVRRIDRVSPEWAASMTIKPVEVPDAY